VLVRLNIQEVRDICGGFLVLVAFGMSSILGDKRL
jgi:hypothetical protein